MRGNVDTRWRKLLDPAQGYDALVLAAAGLARLGLEEAPRQPIPYEVLLPAPGQGALGLEIREDDAETRTRQADASRGLGVAVHPGKDVLPGRRPCGHRFIEMERPA